MGLRSRGPKEKGKQVGAVGGRIGADLAVWPDPNPRPGLQGVISKAYKLGTNFWQVRQEAVVGSVTVSQYAVWLYTYCSGRSLAVFCNVKACTHVKANHAVCWSLKSCSAGFEMFAASAP